MVELIKLEIEGFGRFDKKKTIDKLPFLHFRLYSPNLSLGQALAAFSFEESETIN